MPHTRPWSVTAPAGTVQAKQIDDEIRKLRVDIDERMADVAVDFTADPVVLQSQYLGNVDGKQLVIPYSAFSSTRAGLGVKEVIVNVGFLNAFTDSPLLIAPVILPPGATITTIEVMIDKGDAASIAWDFYARAFAAGEARVGSQTAMVSLIHKTEAGVNVLLSTSGVVALPIDANHLYYIVVDGVGPAGNSFDLYGARITYNVADCRVTI
jgi:hypothetical protein